MSGEAILSAENSGKPLGRWGSAPNPHSAHPDAVAGEEGLAAPLQEPHPRFRPLQCLGVWIKHCPNNIIVPTELLLNIVTNTLPKIFAVVVKDIGVVRFHHRKRKFLYSRYRPSRRKHHCSDCGPFTITAKVLKGIVQ